MHIYLELLIVFLIAGLAPALSYADEIDNVRENCRRSVAGAYISGYDKMVHAKEFTEFLQKDLVRYKQAEILRKKAWEQAESDAAKKDYDVKLARNKDDATSALANVQSQINQIEQLINAAKADYATAKVLNEKFEKKITKVFKIVEMRTETKGYPLQLEYKSSCSKFRHSCPLPREEAFELLKIFENQPEGIDCRKYAGISGIQ